MHASFCFYPLDARQYDSFKVGWGQEIWLLFLESWVKPVEITIILAATVSHFLLSGTHSEP